MMAEASNNLFAADHNISFVRKQEEENNFFARSEQDEMKHIFFRSSPVMEKQPEK